MTDHSADVVATWSESDVEVDGRSLHVHRAGDPDRPTIVLAHGLSDSGRCWWRVVDALVTDFDLVMLDARNHGRSSTVIDGPPPTGDVAAVVDRLGIERPVLIGHSMGAQTMAEYVAGGPGRASRLVLIDPPFHPEAEIDAAGLDGIRPAIRAWLASFGGMSAEEIGEVGRREHSDWPAEEFPTWIESKQQVRSEAADDLSAAPWGPIVAAFDCPTLLVHGDPDRGGIVTPAVARRIAELNDRVTVRAIDTAGHNIHREDFERFIEVLRAWWA
jgi:pimeloyl-ACP methyl ester carboxylesterase